MRLERERVGSWSVPDFRRRYQEIPSRGSSTGEIPYVKKPLSWLKYYVLFLRYTFRFMLPWVMVYFVLNIAIIPISKIYWISHFFKQKNVLNDQCLFLGETEEKSGQPTQSSGQTEETRALQSECGLLQVGSGREKGIEKQCSKRERERKREDFNQVTHWDKLKRHEHCKVNVDSSR